MGGLWKRNGPFVIALAVWLVGSPVVFVGVPAAFSWQLSELRRAADGGVQPGSDAAPYAEALQAALGERKQLDAALVAAARTVEFKPGAGFAIGADVTARSGEYVKIRERATAELRELAGKGGLTVAQSLDPRPEPKDPPPEGEADELVFRLAMTDRVIRDAAAAGVSQVGSVTHELGMPRGAPVCEWVVSVQIEGTLDAVMGFIERCSRPPDGAEGGGILAVRSVAVRNARESAVSAQVALAAVKVTDVKGLAAVRMTDVKGPGPSAPPPGATRPGM